MYLHIYLVEDTIDTPETFWVLGGYPVISFVIKLHGSTSDPVKDNYLARSQGSSHIK